MERKRDIDRKEFRVKTEVINSRYLTSECWSIQFWGLPYCRECEYLGTEDCGGYSIRKQILAKRYPRDGLPRLR